MDTSSPHWHVLIVLIVISILVTVTEVTLRFGILEKEKGKGKTEIPSQQVELRGIPPGLGLGNSGVANLSMPELIAWAASLSEEERGAVCGGQIVGKTFAGV